MIHIENSPIEVSIGGEENILYLLVKLCCRFSRKNDSNEYIEFVSKLPFNDLTITLKDSPPLIDWQGIEELERQRAKSYGDEYQPLTPNDFQSECKLRIITDRQFYYENYNKAVNYLSHVPKERLLFSSSHIDVEVSGGYMEIIYKE